MHLVMGFLRVISVFLLIAATGVQAFAQQAGQTEAAPSTAQAQAPEEIQADPSEWIGLLDSITQALDREGLTAAQLDGFIDEATKIRDLAIAEERKLGSRVAELEQQLAEIGPKPEDGQEAQAVTDRRDILSARFTDIDARFKQTKLAAIRAQQIQTVASDELRNRFFRSISVRSREIATPSFWIEFTTGFSGFFRSLDLLLTDSWAILLKTFAENRPLQFGFPALVLILTYLFVRIRRLAVAMQPSAFSQIEDQETRKYLTAFLFYVSNAVLPALFVILLYWLFSFFGLLTARIETLIVNVVVAIVFLMLGLNLLSRFFAPHDSENRLVAMSTEPAQKISRILSTGLIASIVLFLLNETSRVLVSPIEVSVGLSLILGLFVSICFILSFNIHRKDKAERTKSVGRVAMRRIWRLLAVTVWVASIAVHGAALTGYVAFSEFLGQQLIFGLIIIGNVVLLSRFVEYGFIRWIPEPQQDFVGPAPEGAGASAMQARIFGIGVSKLLIYLVAGILLLLPWGYRTSDLFRLVNQVFFGFEVGGLSISLATVLLAGALFFAGYTITIALRSWLNTKFLPTTKLDIGVSNSISTVFGYAGFILAAVLAISAAGFDMSNLAIVAGALSVGVGFGLQSIVNNFVSGLILLAERPIKAGDWIITSGGEGLVKRISVRSTEIETFDHATVIVPNSTLITETVTNWTHGGKLGRVRIAVGVAYGTNPNLVRDILLSCAGKHALVLDRPEPTAFLMDFGPDSLNFELRCYLADINYCLSVQSELRYAILEEFAAKDIEIPFPQRDIHIKSDATKSAPARTTKRRSKK